MPTGAESAFSRRALFGPGLRRALGARFDAHPRPAAAPAAAGEADGERLGAQLTEVAANVLDMAGLARGPRRRVVVVAAGDGTPLAGSAARLGHEVVAVEADGALLERGRERLPEIDWRHGRTISLPVGDGSADVVIAWFGATHERDPRAVASELRRVTAEGGTIALTAWTAQAMNRLRAGAPPPRHRPEQWSRYETAYRHFFGLPGLDVHEAAVDVALAAEERVELAYALVMARAAG